MTLFLFWNDSDAVREGRGGLGQPIIFKVKMALNQHSITLYTCDSICSLEQPLR